MCSIRIACRRTKKLAGAELRNRVITNDLRPMQGGALPQKKVVQRFSIKNLQLIQGAARSAARSRTQISMDAAPCGN
jgi:hypothetical protein